MLPLTLSTAVLCCRVVVSSEIAQGGFSFVYRARDTDTGEPFALKKILCQTDEQVQLAKAEIQAHKSFAHPNIMPLSDYAVVSSGPETFEYYLLFPFMEVRARGKLYKATQKG